MLQSCSLESCGVPLSKHVVRLPAVSQERQACFVAPTRPRRLSYLSSCLRLKFAALRSGVIQAVLRNRVVLSTRALSPLQRRQPSVERRQPFAILCVDSPLLLFLQSGGQPVSKSPPIVTSYQAFNARSNRSLEHESGEGRASQATPWLYLRQLSHQRLPGQGYGYICLDGQYGGSVTALSAQRCRLQG